MNHYNGIPISGDKIGSHSQLFNWEPFMSKEHERSICPQRGEIARYARLKYNPSGLRSPVRLRHDFKILRRNT
jgi:hypothetical protein